MDGEQEARSEEGDPLERQAGRMDDGSGALAVRLGPLSLRCWVIDSY